MTMYFLQSHDTATGEPETDKIELSELTQDGFEHYLKDQPWAVETDAKVISFHVEQGNAAFILWFRFHPSDTTYNFIAGTLTAFMSE